MRNTLSSWTTFGIGGKAKTLAVARTREALIDLAPQSLLLGKGSNVLASDLGHDGRVTVNRYAEIGRSGVLVTAGSGATLPALCGYGAENGLSGMEWACGIPGTVGGAVRMNAGAFGGCIADVLVYADVLRNGKLLRLGRKELAFSYRQSGLLDDDVVVSAAFGLKNADRAAVNRKILAYRSARRLAQPTCRSAGSVFKNVGGVSVGKVFDECGLKGTRRGGAVISPRHANIIVNTGGATAKDVLGLMAIMERVLIDKGIPAQKEIIFIGEPMDIG